MRACRCIPLVASLAALSLLAQACGSRPSGKPVRRAKQRVFVMGFDGMDPTLARRFMDEGKLPNLKKLSETGTFAKLETTQPSESPVAWASFATGVNPGKHNIYDFLVRDTSTYLPDLGMVTREPPRFLLNYIPIAKLPNIYDPPSGMIVTANQRIVGTDYPYFLTHSWAQPYRARRIFDLLSEKPKHNADDFRRILGDVYSIAGSTFARETVRTLRPTLTPPADDKLRATLDAFEKWDGRVNAESTVAPMMAQMRLAFRSKILTAALGPDLVKSFQWSNFDTALDRIIKDQPANWLPKEFPTYAALLRASFDEARQTLTRNMGADESKWTWGESTKVRFPHPLSGAPLIGVQFTVPPFPQNGTGGFIGATVNVGAAVSMRLIADPGDWDKTQMGIALGESGLNKSPYWSDQLADWRAVTPRVFPFTQAAVTKATKETLVLEPAK